MNIQMKNYQSNLLILTLAMLASFAAQAGDVASTFSTGDTLTATQMTEIKDAVNDNDTRATANKGDILTNTANIASSTANISTNTADITSIKATVIDIDTRSIANEGDVFTNTANISSNTANISSNTANIAALQTGVLQSGKTLRGTFSIEFTAAGAGNRGTSAITFPLELATAPIAVFGNIIKVGDAATTECPGTSGNPQALAGHLCLYEVSRVNIGSGGSSQCIAKVGSTYACNLSDTWGSTVFVTSAGAGRTTSAGSWAVTAP